MFTKELSIEELSDEAIGLLRMEMDDLYATLGFQLLGSAPVTRVTAIANYLSAVGKGMDAPGRAYDSFAVPKDWRERLENIYDGLRQEGVRFFDEVKDELRKDLSNEDFWRLAEEINKSKMQLMVVVVSALLKNPPQLEPISATVAAILCKSGMRNFYQ